MKAVEWVLRVGVFGTFLGHGLLAISTKSTWIAYLMTVGFSREQAMDVMPMIGYLDVIIAIWVLLKPNKFVVGWAIFWTFTTATIRPLSGEPFLEFVERAANWATPLALYILLYSPKWSNRLFHK